MKKLTIYAISFLTAFQMAPVFVLAQEAVAPTKETSATKSVAEEVKEKRAKGNRFDHECCNTHL